jgi:hypothetical protein
MTCLYAGDGVRNDPRVHMLVEEAQFDAVKEDRGSYMLCDSKWEGPGYYFVTGDSRPCPRGCCTDEWLYIRKQYHVYGDFDEQMDAELEHIAEELLFRGADAEPIYRALLPEPLVQSVGGDIQYRGVHSHPYYNIECQCCGAVLEYKIFYTESQLSYKGWILNNNGALCPNCPDQE